jgi:hypothetical protein
VIRLSKQVSSNQHGRGSPKQFGFIDLNLHLALRRNSGMRRGYSFEENRPVDWISQSVKIPWAAR